MHRQAQEFLLYAKGEGGSEAEAVQKTKHPLFKNLF